MTPYSDIRTSALILRYCIDIENAAHYSRKASSDKNRWHYMATDRTGDANYAWEIAGYLDLIRDGKPTRDGRIVATLMHSNKEVTYEKVKQISTAIDGEDLQASHLSSSQYRSQVPPRTG